MSPNPLPIYLDYNATTPTHPEVSAAMRPYLDQYFGNPSSSHYYGHTTRKAVEKARGVVAEFFGCTPEEIYFTSGGTESDNWAIKGYAWAHRDKGKHIITTNVEHPAVLDTCRYLQDQGFKVTYLPVDKHGMVSVEDVKESITDQTILITVMQANNEVGTIQPVGEIGEIARDKGIVFHSDAAQAVGKVSTKVDELHVDMLTVAGHKLYAPKGVGALYIRKGVELEKFFHGAKHERGQRAGTENVLAIVGLGKACEVIASEGVEEKAKHMAAMRDRLQKGLREHISHIQVNGHLEKRLPNTLSVSFLKIDSSALLSELSDKVAVSAGAACHGGGKKSISHVLQAMGVPEQWSLGTIRFSTGGPTTEEEIDRAINYVTQAVDKLREDEDVKE